jgi:hypothetical protein
MGNPTNTDINQGRWSAELGGDFVVFLIGARFNRKRSLLASLKDLSAMRGPALDRMCAYLLEHPEKGFLGYEKLSATSMVQYWRSFEHLERFARDQDDPHLEAWRTYWRRVGSSTRTGIWHETYLVRAGAYEVAYGNMPSFGLAKAGTLIPMAERTRARDRLGAAAG